MEPMAEGGQWLSMGGTGTPHYVVDPAHIARLQAEGYQIVADPRIPAEPEQASEDEQSPEDEQEPEKDEVEDYDTNGRIAAIKPTHKSRTRGLDTTSR